MRRETAESSIHVRRGYSEFDNGDNSDGVFGCTMLWLKLVTGELSARRLYCFGVSGKEARSMSWTYGKQRRCQVETVTATQQDNESAKHKHMTS